MNFPVQQLGPPRHWSKPCNEPGEESDVLCTRPNEDMDALPFKKKGKHPNSHVDNMSDKQVHPSTPLPHLVLSSLEETQESNCLCLSSATIG